MAKTIKGRRIMMVSMDMLIAFLKGPAEAARTYTVVDALPADASIVAILNDDYQHIARVVLESAEWSATDASYKELVSPSVTVHYEAVP